MVVQVKPLLHWYARASRKRSADVSSSRSSVTVGITATDYVATCVDEEAGSFSAVRNDAGAQAETSNLGLRQMGPTPGKSFELMMLVQVGRGDSRVPQHCYARMPQRVL